MYTENQFVREFKDSNNPKEIWRLRSYYRSLSKKEKKKISSELVKYKQSLSFKEWWKLISYNIEMGHKKHQKDKRKPFLVDMKLEALKEEMNTKEFREYHKLPTNDE